MGQDASRLQKGARYIPDHDTFRRRIALVRPPQTVMQHCLGIDDYEEAHHACQSNCRLLRSIKTNIVCWDGENLLPEQWLSVLGNQSAFIYFFDDNVDYDLQETREALEFCIGEAKESSPDAVIYAVHWSGDPLLERPKRRQEGDEEEEEEGEEGADDFPPEKQPEPQQAPGSELPQSVALDLDEEYRDEDARDGEETPRGIIDFQGLCREFGVQHYIDVTDVAELHNVECILAEHFTPMELVRPLACLLYDLVEACGAESAWLLDSATMLPLLSTLDDPVKVSSPIVEAVRVLRSPLRRMMNRLGCEEVHLVSLQLSGMRVVVGWACRPYAYVLMLVPTSGEFRIGDALLEANMERYSIHFGNVINTTSKSKRHQPILSNN